MTPFRATKGTVYEGGFRVPALIRWPGKVPSGKVENGLFSGLDWFPTFVAAAGNPNIVDELRAGKELGGTNYKVHLDGYNQLDLLTGKGPTKRHEIWYFADGWGPFASTNSSIASSTSRRVGRGRRSRSTCRS